MTKNHEKLPSMQRVKKLAKLNNILFKVQNMPLNIGCDVTYGHRYFSVSPLLLAGTLKGN